MLKRDKLKTGKVYRWRCDRRGNDIAYCSNCDNKHVSDSFPRSYIWLQTYDSQYLTEAHRVKCGDYVVFLKTTGCESIKVLTMVENPIIGDMHYSGISTGKLFLVKNL
jgi:hypothetical protein